MKTVRMNEVAALLKVNGASASAKKDATNAAPANVTSKAMQQRLEHGLDRPELGFFEDRKLRKREQGLERDNYLSALETAQRHLRELIEQKIASEAELVRLVLDIDHKQRFGVLAQEADVAEKHVLLALRAAQVGGEEAALCQRMDEVQRLSDWHTQGLITDAEHLAKLAEITVEYQDMIDRFKQITGGHSQAVSHAFRRSA